MGVLYTLVFGFWLGWWREEPERRSARYNRHSVSRWESYVRQVLIGAVLSRVPLVLYVYAWLWRRLLLRTTFVAVSGSLGKTTTKELLGAVLKEHAPTFRSWRNQNSRSAVALNILRVRPWHRFAVIEVEGGAPGAMDWPAWFVAPDVALMLCIAPTHTSAYSDLDAHASELVKIIRHTRPKGLVLLNADDPRVVRMAAEFSGRKLFFGIAAETNGVATEADSPSMPISVLGTVAGDAWPERLRVAVSVTAPFQANAVAMETQLVGAHWAHAVVGVYSAAWALGVPPERILASLAKAPPFPGRLYPVTAPNGAVFLRDDYNASMHVLDASLEVLRRARAKRRILVLTDFSDSGANRRKRLRLLSERLAGCADAFLLIGKDSQYGGRMAVQAGLAEENVHHFPGLEAAAEFLRTWTSEGDLVLVKGRTTDHAARIVLAQFTSIGCWRDYCPKRMLCDICWELGSGDPKLLQIEALPAVVTALPADA